MSDPIPSRKSFYKLWVFWVVIIYLLFIASYNVFFFFSEGKNVLLSANELGDFLAGAFAPLAFLFLYLGYKQNSESIRIQTQELKASTEALVLQVAEMKESVEQQKELVTIQKQEAEAKHFSVRPHLIFKYPTINFSLRQNIAHTEDNETIYVNDEIYHELDISFTIINQSNTAYLIKIINTHTNYIEDQFFKIPQDSEEISNFTLNQDDINLLLDDDKIELIIHFEYFDSYGKPFKQILKLHIDNYNWSLENTTIRIHVLND